MQNISYKEIHEEMVFIMYNVQKAVYCPVAWRNHIQNVQISWMPVSGINVKFSPWGERLINGFKQWIEKSCTFEPFQQEKAHWANQNSFDQQVK